LLVIATPLGFSPCACAIEIWVDSLPSQPGNLWVEPDSPSSELQQS
ncbi:unnamed protein product, partial [Ectocarpus sp. 12 AP-2014]